MKKNDVLIIAGIAVLVIIGISYLALRSSIPGEYDDFAACLKEKGVIFYGAFWCPHCQNQKKLFGKSQKLLPYVECSTPDGRGQLQVCIDKKITGYPTWEFSDGSRLSGEVALETLAEKAGCELKRDASSAL